YGRYGIRVNTMAPGGTDVTDRVTPRQFIRPGVMADEGNKAEADGYRREMAEDIRNQQALQQRGLPEEQAAELWGHELDRDDGEFVGRCPYCDADLYIVLGEGRFFCATEEWVNRKATRREPISPCAPTRLPQVGRWLHSQCLASADGVLATSICHLFGSSICSNCGQSFQVPDAIGKVFRGC